jgi:glutathione synthase/RimK-type ligase-like ATP-grasp enzyme
MKIPRLLIFSSDPAIMGLARLPKALKNAGFEVAAICFPQSFIAKTRYLDRIFFLTESSFPLIKTMNSVKLLQQLVESIKVWQPDLVIFGDETTITLIHYVIQHADEFTDLMTSHVLEILKASLGSPEFFEASLFKHKTLEVVHQLGLRAPAIAAVKNSEEALQFAEKNGYPIVLKKSFSCSGLGVKVCVDQQDLLASLPDFLPRATSLLKSSIKRSLKRNWLPQPKVLGLQQFIQGPTAMYSVVAFNGEVLAGFADVIEHNCSATGPSSVIRFIDHPEMQATAIALIKKFQFTGFASFDFILEEGTSHAYLLECNPRPVPVLHLAPLVGVDLSKALFMRLQGQEWEPQLVVEKELSVALFPQEWKRDPSSENLHHFYHDVPWDDPELVKAYIS